MEFIIALIKGCYPYFSVPAIFFMLKLLRKKHWKKEYTILLILFFIGVFSVVIQIIISDNVLYISRRYLLPYTPVIFIFLALPIYILRKKISRRKFFLIFILIILLLFIDGMWPIMKNYVSSKKYIRNREVLQMVAIINKQKLNSTDCNTERIWWYEPRFPSQIIIKDAPSKLLWLVHGKSWSPYFPHERIDYFVIEDVNKKIISNDSILLFQGNIYSLYKNLNTH